MDEVGLGMFFGSHFCNAFFLASDHYLGNLKDTVLTKLWPVFGYFSTNVAIRVISIVSMST